MSHSSQAVSFHSRSRRLAILRDKEEAMYPRWIFAVILGTFPTAAASAQQSHLDMRRQIEQLAATFSERYNKQDAGALANMFTKDAVRVHIRQ